MKSQGILVLVLGLFLIAMQQSANAQDVVKVAPGMHKVLLENDHVRVYEFKAKVGDKIGMHSHPAHIVYVKSGGKVKFTMADGSTAEREMKTGDAVWVDAVTHSVEVLGPGDVTAIITELKDMPATKTKKMK